MNQATNEEREQRILDAAGDLFVHYGYDKTTVSDIAQQAGISKGAIYLHFASKEALLEALMQRELEQYTAAWLAGIEADPRGGTIGGMYRNVLQALCSSPFLAAMFTQDGRVLGNYLRKPDNLFQNQAFKGTRREFINMMQAAGLVRADLDPHVTAHIMNMLAFGLVGMDDIMDRADMPPTVDLINGIAGFMDAALTPAGVHDSEEGKAIIKQLVSRQRENLTGRTPAETA